MVTVTQSVKLDTTTSSDAAADIIDRSNLEPLKWCSFTVEDGDCYIRFNSGAATSSDMYIKQDEVYTTPPMKARITRISVIRKTSTNVTIRGSAWW